MQGKPDIIAASAPTDSRILQQKIKEYVKQSRYFIMTSRFTESTWKENINFRANKTNFKCIYCSPEQVSARIPTDSVMFVLEMNNDKNKIMGIGMVKNHPRVQMYGVYENYNYNRYNFVGKHRIDREDMTEEEDEIMRVFDTLCFKGNKHMKRGQGLKMFSAEMLYKMLVRFDLVEYIKEMFKIRMSMTS